MNWDLRELAGIPLAPNILANPEAVVFSYELER